MGWAALELWSVEVWAVALVFAGIAGIIRGLTGFGFPLVVITAVSLVAAPISIVPVALLLDLAIGVRLIRHVYTDVDRQGTLFLTLGAAIAIPAGVWVLTIADESWMRLSVGLFVLISVILIARGFQLSKPPGKALAGATGILSGFLSGAVGMPGPPLILLYLSAPLPVAVLRGTAVAFFLFTDIVSLGAMGWSGILDWGVLVRAALLWPVAEIGVWAGRQLYGVASGEQVKRLALMLLGVLGLTAIIKATFALLIG